MLEFFQGRIGTGVMFMYRKHDFDYPTMRQGKVVEVKETKNGSYIVLLETSQGPKSFKVNQCCLEV